MKIEVIDDFLKDSEQEIILQECSKPIWRYGWTKKGKMFEKPCLHAFIAGMGREELLDCQEELSESPQWGVLSGVWARIKELSHPDCRLIGVYANGMTHGMETHIHRDNKKENPSQTAVLFAHGYWPALWGGELVFFNHTRDEIVKAVRPAPKRLVIFDGRIPHAVKMPAAICDRMRLSIAFKTYMNREE